MLPKILTDFNVFVDGIGFAGVAKEVMLPKVVEKTIEIWTSGMSAPVDVPTGDYEKMTSEITFEETPADIVRLIKNKAVGAIGFRLVGKRIDPNNNSQPSDIEVVLRGNIREIDQGSWRRGNDNSGVTKFSISAAYYRIEVNGAEALTIDALSPSMP